MILYQTLKKTRRQQSSYAYRKARKLREQKERLLMVADAERLEQMFHIASSGIVEQL